MGGFGYARWAVLGRSRRRPGTSTREARHRARNLHAMELILGTAPARTWPQPLAGDPISHQQAPTCSKLISWDKDNDDNVSWSDWVGNGSGSNWLGAHKIEPDLRTLNRPKHIRMVLYEPWGRRIQVRLKKLLNKQ